MGTLQIIVGDLTMAGDNVVIIGSLTSGLPARERRRDTPRDETTSAGTSDSTAIVRTFGTRSVVMIACAKSPTS